MRTIKFHCTKNYNIPYESSNSRWSSVLRFCHNSGCTVLEFNKHSNKLRLSWKFYSMSIIVRPWLCKMDNIMDGYSKWSLRRLILLLISENEKYDWFYWYTMILTSASTFRYKCNAIPIPWTAAALAPAVRMAAASCPCSATAAEAGVRRAVQCGGAVLSWAVRRRRHAVQCRGTKMKLQQRATIWADRPAASKSYFL